MTGQTWAGVRFLRWQGWSPNTHPDCTAVDSGLPSNSLSPYFASSATAPGQPTMGLPSSPPTVLAKEMLGSALEGQSCLCLCLSEDTDSQRRDKMITGFITPKKTHPASQCPKTQFKLYLKIMQQALWHFQMLDDPRLVLFKQRSTFAYLRVSCKIVQML